MNGTPKNADYFDIAPSDIRPDSTIPFDLYFYFKGNDHLVLFRERHQLVEGSILAQYAKKGLKSFWIHHRDREAYTQYVKAPIYRVQTREGELAGRALTSSTLSESSKKKVATELGAHIVTEAAKADTAETHLATQRKQRAVMQDLIQHAARPEHKDLIQDMLEMARIDPNLEHSVNVSMYTVMFSLAFGHIDPKLLSDLAMAALLHDFGLTQLRWADAKQTWTTQSPPQQKIYARHVDLGIEVLAGLPQASSLNPKDYPRIYEIIRQSHEKFDGTGYPRALKGFDFDDLAQLLALAELVDSISSGQYDGSSRTFKESFQVIEAWEKESNFPRFFNPDIFQLIQHWVHSEHSKSSLQTAARADSSQVWTFSRYVCAVGCGTRPH